MTADTKADDDSASGMRGKTSQHSVLAPIGRYLSTLASCAGVAAVIVLVVVYLTPLKEPVSKSTDTPKTTPDTRQPPVRHESAVSLASIAVPATAEQLQDEAERVASELRSRFPNLAEALHVVALMHSKFRRTAEAEKLWRKCIELSPNDEGYYVNLAAVAMERGNCAMAAETLQQAIDAGHSSPDILHHLAVALMNLGQCEEAEAVIEKGLAAYPQFSSGWLVLGEVQLKLGKPAEAEASLRKAIELGSRSAETYFALASACARQGKHEGAASFRKQFTELTKTQPLEAQQRFQVLSRAEALQTTVAVLSEAAIVHSWQGDSLEAERLLLRAIALDPLSVQSCRTLASLYQGVGMYAEERVVRKRLVEIQPYNFDNYRNLAKVSMQLGEPEAAEAALKLAIAMTPEAANAYATLAQFYVEAGKPKPARWFAQEAVRREPTAEGYALLASTCRLLGDDADAEAAMNMARKLDAKSSSLQPITTQPP